MHTTKFAFLLVLALAFFASTVFAVEDREDSEGSSPPLHDLGSGITGNPGGGSAVRSNLI